jgi:diguanylate cyclase (GGDEF)-like protein
MTVPLPENETNRITALRQLDLVDTPAEGRFDRITRLAQRVFDAPFAMIALMEEHRQWFKSAMGHLIIETPRAESFCKFTIAQDSPLVVHDAASDSRYFDLPVVFDMGVRFYAGIPIRSVDGKAVGTLCVLDLKTRETGAAILEPLEDLARWAQAEFQLEGLLKSERLMLEEMDDLRRKASVDPVSRCWTPDVGVMLLERMMEEKRPTSFSGLGVALIKLENLDTVNETVGEDAGNMYLKEAADRIRRFAPPNTSLCRARASHFLLLWPEMPARECRAEMETLLQRLAEKSMRLSPQIEFQMPVCSGMSVYTGATASAEILLDSANKALQQARKAGPGTFRQAM